MDADKVKISSQDSPDWSKTEGDRGGSCSAVRFTIRWLLHLGSLESVILFARVDLLRHGCWDSQTEGNGDWVLKSWCCPCIMAGLSEGHPSSCIDCATKGEKVG